MYVRYLQFKSPLSFSVNEKLIFFWYNLPKPTNQFLAVTNFLLNWFPPLPSPPSDPRDRIASKNTCLWWNIDVGYLSFISWHVKANTFFALGPNPARYSIKPTKLLIAWQTLVAAVSLSQNYSDTKDVRSDSSPKFRDSAADLHHFEEKLLEAAGERSWFKDYEGWLNPQSWRLRDKADDGPFSQNYCSPGKTDLP